MIIKRFRIFNVIDKNLKNLKKSFISLQTCLVGSVQEIDANFVLAGDGR